MRTPPGSALSHHRVEDHQELPHTRNQSHLLGLAGRHQPFVELPDGGIEARSDQGSHVECLPNPRPAAPYGAPASQGAGVPVERSDPNEGRELPGRKRAELGQLRKERPAKHRTYSGNTPQESLVRLEGRAVFDDLIEIPVGASELFFEPPYVGLDASADGLGGARPEAVFLSGQHADDLPSSGENLPKVPGLARVDHEEGHSRGGQGGGYGTLEACCGLQDHQSLRDLGELAKKLLDPGLVVGSDEAFTGGEDSNIQGSLGDVYAHVGSSFSSGAQTDSPFSPASLGSPNLAGTGSGSSPAQATVRAPPEVSVRARRSWLSHGLKSAKLGTKEHSIYRAHTNRL